MEPLLLYQIPFSHFCDKVRWALDYYSIPYKAINYTGRRTKGLEKAPRSLQKLTPIIEDPNNNSLFISDSTPILIYLDKHYSNNNTLFPENKKDDIIQYCLKLDSHLGLYSRRLAYLHVVSEQPAILSVFIDGNFDKLSCDDWKSYFNGLLSSCILIGRLGIHQIKDEHIFEKTVSILEEIKENINGKKYLFNNEFTAADLTLASLIHPLRFVEPLYIKYKSVFEFCNEIRERHDPKNRPDYNVERLFINRRRKNQSTIRSLIWFIFYILFYPLQFLFKTDAKKSFQYPSTNPEEKANNDVQVLKLNSMINTLLFGIKYFWHLCFTIPEQMEYVKNEGNKILQK